MGNCGFGAGGSLGNVISVSGIGNALGELVLSWPIPAVIIPFIIAAMMRIALGSATVAITTAASLSAPIADQLGISPILLALVCRELANWRIYISPIS